MEEKRYGILDIPDIALMSVTTLQELADLYKNRLGVYPRAVSLPVTSAGGVTYETRLGIDNVSPVVDNARYDLPRLIDEASRYGLDVYLVVIPTLPFATTSSDFNLVDSVGDETPKCCVVNPFTQQAIQEVIKESLVLSQQLGILPKGYVLVVQDLWPMSADKERLELTCFCRHCREALSRVAGLDWEAFKHFPNPWNLALKDTGSGISHLSEIEIGDQPRQILAKSKDRGFYNPQWFSSDPHMEEVWARQLYLYMHGRNDITREAILNLKRAVPEDVPTVLMADAFEYDWTSGMFFSTVLEVSSENVWIPPTARRIRARSAAVYMVSRGRYLVDALFELVHFIARVTRLDPTWSATDRPDIRFNFVSRSTKLLEALHFSRMEILPVLSEDREFVVPVISEEIVRRLMDHLGLQVASVISQLARLAELFRSL